MQKICYVCVFLCVSFQGNLGLKRFVLGLRPTGFFGSFYMDNSTDMEMGAIDSDKVTDFSQEFTAVNSKKKMIRYFNI